MEYRHLDYPQDVAINEIGLAALDDLLDRGDLESWAPLAAAVRADPHGPLAENVLRVCEAHPMYGTSSLWRSWIERLRDEGTAKGMSLNELRRNRGLTQQEIGERMGMSQSDVSKLERRRDVRLSTLRSYLSATGAKLEVWAAYDGGDEKAQIHFR